MPWIGSLNTNWSGYEEGKSVTSPSGQVFDLSWAKRSDRLVQLLLRDVRCSLLAVQECDTAMLDALCAKIKAAGGGLTAYVGGVNLPGPYSTVHHDKNAFLYDPSKWSWQDLVVHQLPDADTAGNGLGTRTLLGADFTYAPSGEKVRAYTVHLVPANPEGRAIQAADMIRFMAGEACVLAGDLNAMSFRRDPLLPPEGQGPRVQLADAGWVEAPYQAYPHPTYNAYGRPGVGTARIDGVYLSPEAAINGLTFGESTTGPVAEIVPGLTPPSGPGSAYASDHEALRALVWF